MSKNIIAPPVRFQGFTEPWEQRKLGEIGTTFSGLSGKAKEDFGHGEAQFVTYMNVYLNAVSDSSMTERVEIDDHQNKVQYGDVFFTTSSETPDEVGMSSVWFGSKDNTYLNSFCFGFRPTKEIDPYYMAFMLRSDIIRRKIIILAQGISRYNLSKKQVMKTAVPLPELSEQYKIGAYLQSLDRLITLHQRKLELMKKLKAFFQKNMFLEEGETVPRIRFKEFTGDWEQRKIADVAEIITGGTPSTRIVEYWNPPEVPWLSSGEVHKKYITSTDTMISRKGYENSSATMVRENSVLIALAGQGKTRGTVAINRIPLATNQSIAAMTFSNDIDPDYVFSNLENRYEELRRISSGDGSRGGLNKKLVGDVTIPCPTLLEQNAIGTLFRVLNELITLHQRKIDQLQNVKKFMLQNLFV